MRNDISAQEYRRLNQMMVWEKKAQALGFQTVAGVDEAGRGPLAGPVVAAACVLPPGMFIQGINDSKQLSPRERHQIFHSLLSLPEMDYGIGIIDGPIIDQINILQASFQAMIAAIQRLSQKPDFLLVDGRMLPVIQIPGEAIVSGDSLSQSIAAASIIAKETRDQIMRIFHERWPQYGFDSHKGYATGEHLQAIQKYGPCPIHRMSFEPFKSLYIQKSG